MWPSFPGGGPRENNPAARETTVVVKVVVGKRGN